MNYIYALRCPLSGSIRYIGKSADPQRRFESHIVKAHRADAKHHCANWIRGLLRQGCRPSLEVLFCVLDGVDWRDVERNFISEYLADGHPLTNQTRGGDGVDLMYASDQLAARSALSASMRSAWADPGKRASLLGGTRGLESRARRSDAMKKLHADPDFRERRLAAVIAKARSPEVLSKLRAVAARPEVRQAKIAANRAKSPEVRARQAAALKASWARRKAAAQTA
jgi:hypothetical protein